MRARAIGSRIVATVSASALTLGMVTAVGVTAGSVLTAAPAQALVDQNTIASSWRPSGGIAHAITRVGDMIIIGGTFTGMRSPSGTTATRNRIAAVSATTGELLPWNPNVNGSEVRTVAASPDGSRVYIGGTFTSIGGVAKTNAAAVSATTGAVIAGFTANANNTVRQLKFIDNRLFLVGTFGKVNSTNRGNGAEVDPTTGALKIWDPKVSAGLITVAGAADGIFVGGYFTKINGISRDYAAKVDKTTGAVLGWSSQSSCSDTTNPCYVWDILPGADGVFLATGGPGGRIVNLDPVTGSQRWWTGADGDFTSIVRDGNKLYASGHFEDAVNGFPRGGIVVLDARTGAVLPDFTTAVVGGSGVWQVILDNGWLRGVGQFTSVGSAAIGKYVSFALTPDPVDTSAPTAPGAFRIPAALSDQTSLTWTAATDDVAPVEYRIIRDGQQIATANGTVFKDRTVTPGTTYTYTVRAVDGAGNVSPDAKAVTVTTEPAATRLLARGAPWRFLSLGTEPGAGWQDAGFNDSGWGQGLGEFGFGDGDEDQYISPKGVAHHFRTTFDVADASRVSTVVLRAVVDDGAVMYLNGTEVARVNMPAGTPGIATLASGGISGTAEMVYQSFAIPANRLRNGTNTLAVEVHNSSATSSDVSFDAFITANVAAAPTAPAAPTGLDSSATVDSISLEWAAVPDAQSYSVFRDGVAVGTTSTRTFTDTGLTAGTSYSYTVTATNAVATGPASAPHAATTLAAPPEKPATPAGVQVTNPTSSQLTVSWDAADRADRYIVFRDDVALPPTTATSFTDTGLNPGTSYRYTVKARNAGGDSAASDPAVGTTGAAPISTYVAAGDTWRFLDNVADAPGNWNQPGFDAGSWKTGKAQFGYGDGDEVTLWGWGTSSTRKPITNYVRTTFDAGGSVSDVSALALRAIIDDGAVVYLNGQEVWRFNLPTGPITSTTRAQTAVMGNDESRWRTVDLPASALQPGTNTIAVEVHQDLPSSSDTSFDLELKPLR